MSGYKIVFFADGDTAYIQFDAPNEEAARAAFESMAAMKHSGPHSEGSGEFVFNNLDDMVLIDRNNKPVSVWNRHKAKSPSDYDHFDFNAFMSEPLGYQIVNKEGIHDFDLDTSPFGLHSFEVLIGPAVDVAREWIEETEGYSLVPVFKGDIEEPSFIHRLERPMSKVAPGF